MSDRTIPSPTLKYTLFEKYLPFAICILLPWLNILNNQNGFEGRLPLIIIIARALLVSAFLLAIWYFNQIIAYSYSGIQFFTRILSSNILIISVFLFNHVYIIPHYLKPENESTIGFIIIKLIMASLLFLFIILTIKATRDKELLRNEIVELQSANYKAQFDQLNRQVNPHFLFNSLSTLRAMIRHKNPLSEEFVMNLSNVYRNILTQKSESISSLIEELNTLASYVGLLQMRHQDSFRYKEVIFPESHEYTIPTFALQLLVENCFKHNVVSESKPLLIEVSQPQKNLIKVTNNYQPKYNNNDSLGLGLENLKKRYQLLGISDGVKVEHTDFWFAVTLKLIK